MQTYCLEPSQSGRRVTFRLYSGCAQIRFHSPKVSFIAHLLAKNYTPFSKDNTKNLTTTALHLPILRSVKCFACLEGTGSRLSACSFVKMLFFCLDMLYRLCKHCDHVIMLSKNQSSHSPGTHLHLINLNICKYSKHPHIRTHDFGGQAH